MGNRNNSGFVDLSISVEIENFYWNQHSHIVSYFTNAKTKWFESKKGLPSNSLKSLEHGKEHHKILGILSWVRSDVDINDRNYNGVLYVFFDSCEIAGGSSLTQSKDLYLPETL